MSLSGLNGKIFCTTDKNKVQDGKDANLVIYGMDANQKIRITVSARFDKDTGVIKQFRPEEACYDGTDKTYGIGTTNAKKIEKFITGTKIEDLNY